MEKVRGRELSFYYPYLFRDIKLILDVSENGCDGRTDYGIRPINSRSTSEL